MQQNCMQVFWRTKVTKERLRIQLTRKKNETSYFLYFDIINNSFQSFLVCEATKLNSLISYRPQIIV